MSNNIVLLVLCFISLSTVNLAGSVDCVHPSPSGINDWMHANIDGHFEKWLSDAGIPNLCGNYSNEMISQLTKTVSDGGPGFCSDDLYFANFNYTTDPSKNHFIVGSLWSTTGTYISNSEYRADPSKGRLYLWDPKKDGPYCLPLSGSTDPYTKLPRPFIAIVENSKAHDTGKLDPKTNSPIYFFDPSGTLIDERQSGSNALTYQCSSPLPKLIPPIH